MYCKIETQIGNNIQDRYNVNKNNDLSWDKKPVWCRAK